MEVVLSLIALYCNSYFNYKGCTYDKQVCVEGYVANSLNKPRFSLYDKRMYSSSEQRTAAEAYYWCTQDQSPTTCKK